MGANAFRCGTKRSVWAPGFAMGILLGGCAAPRNMDMEGHTIGKGHFAGGVAASYNISTVVIHEFTGGAEDVLDAVTSDTLALTDPSFRSGRDALLAYSLDPIAMVGEVGIRYGLLDWLDIGYRYTSAGNLWTLQAQVFENGPSAVSVGARYSSADYSLPSVFGDFQEILGYTFERRDLLFPVAWGRKLGKDGAVGSVNAGVALQWTTIRYGFDPDGFYRTVEGELDSLPQVPEDDVSYLGYGVFANARLGYKHVFFVPSLSVFWQNYGSYTVPAQNLSPEKKTLSGTTVVLGVGIEFR